jgi:hypothetical protein
MSSFEINHVVYGIIDSSTVAVVGFNSSYPTIWNLTIPSTVTYSGSLYSVVRINDEAFRACFNLVNCVLPDSVTSIGTRSFYDCYNLVNITLSKSLTVIYSFAFKNAPFSRIILPASLTEIGQFAFLYTNNLKTVIFEGNIPTIGNGNFYQNPPRPVAYYKSNTYNDSIIPSLIPDYFSNAITYTNINDIITINVPQNITGTAGNGTATISWLSVDISITKYEIRYYDIATPINSITVEVNGNITEKIITGLTNFQTYVFSVKAFINNNSSDSSSSVEVTPHYIDTPQNVTGTAGISSATISWSAVNLPGLTKYQISYYNSSTPLSITTVDVSGDITEKIITGLINGATYIFSVKAFINNFSSSASSTVEVTPYSIDIPQNVTGTAGISSATISWSAVNLPGLTKYQISYYNSSTPLSITTVDVSGNITEKNITDLTNGETYIFSVKSFVNDNSSDASSTVEVSLYSVGTPQNVTGKARIRSAIIRWSAVNLPGLTKYQISYYNSSTPLSITTVDVSGNITKKIINNLQINNSYIFTVKAFINSSSSEASNTVTVTLSVINVINDVLNDIEEQPPSPTFFYELIINGYTTQELLNAGVSIISVRTAEELQNLLENFDFPNINIISDISIPNGVLQAINSRISVSNLSGDVLKIIR